VCSQSDFINCKQKQKIKKKQAGKEGKAGKRESQSRRRTFYFAHITFLLFCFPFHLGDNAVSFLLPGHVSFELYLSCLPFVIVATFG